MNKSPKISVIIPVYGVEKHIEKCIQSLLDQSYTDFEAIIIDDGSLDNSIPIAKKLVGSDSRFVFLEKENGGQGSARNLGLDHAQGEYIAFIDSDDYVAPKFLELMLNQIVTENSDICTCNIDVVKNDRLLYEIINNVSEYYKKNDFLLCKDTITSFICDKIFKKEVFKDMRFDESIRTYEDSHFVFRLIFNRIITSIPDQLYFYVQREGSTTNSISPTYIQDKKSVMNTYMEFSKKHYKLSNIKDYLTYCYLKAYVYVVSVGLSRYSINYKNDLKKFKNSIDPYFIKIKNINRLFKSEKKIQFGILVFLLSPTLFRKIIKLRDKLINP